MEGHLGCFRVLDTVNSAAMNIKIHVSFQIMVLSGCMPRSGIAGSYGNSILFFCHTARLVGSLFPGQRLNLCPLYCKLSS